MKKLINRPEDAVHEMLQGFVAIHGDVLLLGDHNVLVRSDAEEVRDRQVALISGGGSGHEPAHGGYVGAGMLSAAVAGQIFSSPAPDAVLAAIKAVTGKPGVLLIVKNYTGDRLNFGFAAEIARAEGIPVEMVVVADDIALGASQQHAGARGIAGAVFVHKIAGAAAAEGKDLQAVSASARETATSVATMGIALSAGTMPASGKATFVLGDDEIEVGLGIHGEPGVRRGPLRRADDLAEELAGAIVSAQQLNANERIAVLINNLGSTTAMELAIFARGAIQALEGRSLVVERAYAGAFMTSLDAAGVSLSILRVNDELLERLDAPTSAPGWPARAAMRTRPPQDRLMSSPPLMPVPHLDRPYLPAGTTQKVVHAACRAVEDAETHLTELDQAVGDGDLGTSLARGARAVREILPILQFGNPADALKAIGLTLQNTAGGSSGALYGVFFLRTATSLGSSGATDPKAWAQAALAACEALSEVGDARAGDRTMLDALLPFATIFGGRLKEGLATADALEAAVKAAEEGAAAATKMMPRRGRSSYLGERAIGYPDPGAVAAALWLRAIVRELSGK